MAAHDALRALHGPESKSPAGEHCVHCRGPQLAVASCGRRTVPRRAVEGGVLRMSDTAAPYGDLPAALTTVEVAETLQCSERHVRALIASGRLGAVHLGRLVRVPRHSLLRLLGVEGGEGATALPLGDGGHSSTVAEAVGRTGPGTSDSERPRPGASARGSEGSQTGGSRCPLRRSDEAHE